jgi:hypothetical protein
MQAYFLTARVTLPLTAVRQRPRDPADIYTIMSNPKLLHVVDEMPVVEVETTMMPAPLYRGFFFRADRQRISLF